MKQRILNNWNVRRTVYLLIGLAILVQGILMKEWIGMAGGGYFTLMGLLGFGCAGGNCAGGNCDTTTVSKIREANKS